MKIQDLITELEGTGVRLWADDGQLRFRAPQGTMTEERRAVLREHKAEVIEHLQCSAEGVRAEPDHAKANDPFPLTEIQAAYLVGRSEAYDYGGVACHAYLELDYPPDLDPQRLEAAWRILVEHHPMLRAVVHPDGFQQVLADVPAYNIGIEDLRGAHNARVVEALDAVRAELSHRMATPERWPLFALRITRADERAVLHLSIDLLVVDYASLQLLLGQLRQLYDEPEAALPRPRIGFRDYVLARRRLVQTSRYNRDRAYWWSRLDELPPAPELPTVEPVASDAARFRRVTSTMTPATWAELSGRAACRGLTPSGVVLTAFAEVIGRWSRLPRFTLNIPTFSRLPVHEDVDDLVGDFTNVELLEVDVSDRCGIAERAKVLRSQLLEDLAHPLCSGSEVLAEISRRGAKADHGHRAALMPVVFTSTLGVDVADRARAMPEVLYALTQTPQVWIDCQVMERAGRLVLSWDVREGVFPDGLVDDAFSTFSTLLHRLARDEAAWDDPAPLPLPILQGHRRRQVNETSGPLPEELLHDAVLAVAQRRPDDIALVGEGRSMSYGEMMARAGAVADRLREADMRSGEIVAVVMDKGVEQVVAVLGILVAGGAYLPIDTNQPPVRRNAILDDASVHHVLTQSWLVSGAAWPDEITPLAVDDLAPAGHLPEPSARRAAPDDLAYLIYTSGSTGVPKGVMISHRAALNTVADINRRFRVGATDAVLGVASLGFDLSVYDIFGLLGVGGRLVLPDHSRRGDPSHWAELIDTHGVTVWNSVPGQLQMLHDYRRPVAGPGLASLRLAMLSGDWIPVTLPDAVRALVPGLEVVSLGGATEASIWSIHYPIGDVDPAWPSIPYGYPLANQRVHVLDGALTPRPDWAVGEIHLGGAGLAMGYFNDEIRTAERFVIRAHDGERLYRTGDLGRQLPDGTVELLGREDSQVKIRGYRIELAEVEATLHLHPAVASAAVILHESPSGRSLAAFVQPDRRHDQPLVGSASAAAAATAAAAAAAKQVDGVELAGFVGAMDELSLLVMARTLAHAGLFADASATHSADDVCAALKAKSPHRRIVRRWLRALVAEEMLLQHDGRYSGLAVASPERVDAAWDRLAEAERRVEWSVELLDYLRTCTDHLAELVSGEAEIHSLLFPGSKLDAIEGAYRDNLAIRHLNKAAAAALADIAANHQGDCPLRVLELGGGVGGTTSELVPALASHHVDYLFTDQSRFFLTEAGERFAEFSWVRYASFDLASGLRQQGQLPNSFDVVVCANTLHHAPDAVAALETVRELLVPGGWLVSIENTRDDNYPLMVSMEFMETLGGEHDDPRRAGEQSFFTRPQWLELMEQAGAEVPLCLPGGGDDLEVLGQHLFLARCKTDQAPVSVAEMAGYAATRLPDYMVPAHWQLVDTMPRSPNGKLDRAVLRSWLPSGPAGQVALPSAVPADELERRLVDLWEELLGRPVGRTDDFFDLGGDSLLVARLVGQLRDRVPDVVDLEWDVVLRHMLRRPTVAGLAAYLRGVTGTSAAQQPTEDVSPVVLLHGTGADPVTVLVHAGVGTVMPYRAMITEIRRRSAGTSSLVGLEIPALETFLDAEPAGLIDSLAAGYTRSLLETGNRHFHVVGYCLGGLIATEVARSLTEAGAVVDTFTAISSHSPPFRLDDELLSEYSFSMMVGIEPATLGFPADPYRVAAAAAAVLDRTPGVMSDGGFAALDGEFEDVARCFAELAERPPMQRVARMCQAIPPSVGSYEPDQMLRLFRTFRQSVFAITRYRPDPYAGDITYLRHSGAYPFPGSKDSVTVYWEHLCLGDLEIVDIPGDHFSCLSVEHAPGVLRLLNGIAGGAVLT